MANLSVEQRLRSNINKLASRRIIDPDETLDSICSLDISSIQDRNVIQYVSEIRELSSKSQPAESANPVRPGCLELTPDNRIVYFGEHEKNLISNLLSSPEILLRMAIDLHGTR
jgi:hypothetical protein